MTLETGWALNTKEPVSATVTTAHLKLRLWDLRVTDPYTASARRAYGAAGVVITGITENISHGYTETAV